MFLYLSAEAFVRRGIGRKSLGQDLPLKLLPYDQLNFATPF